MKLPGKTDKTPDPKLGKDAGEDKDVLYLIEEEAEEEVVSLKQIAMGASASAADEKIRPTQPPLQELKSKRSPGFNEAESLAAVDAPWMADNSEVLDDGMGKSEKKKIPMGLLVAPVVLFGLLGVISGWWMLYGSRSQPQSDAKVPISTSGPNFEPHSGPTETERREASQFYEEVEKTVSRYLAATKLDDYRGLIRHEERVLPLIEEYIFSTPPTPKVYHSISSFQSLGAEKHSMIGMEVRLQNGEICYQPFDLQDFITLRPSESQPFRVYAEPDNFYAYEFADDSKFRSLKITFRDSSEYLNGYIERGTRLEAEFLQLMEERGHNLSPMILEVSFPDSSRAARSVRVEKIISKMWSITNSLPTS